MNLTVKPAIDYDGLRPQYFRPVEIGKFSFDGDGQFCDDDHQMKYLAMPSKSTDLNMDLNEGYYDYIHPHEDREHKFTAMLKWIVNHKDLMKKYLLSSSNSKEGFVFTRGLLTKVSSTPYEKSNDWGIHVTKFQSVIYMHQERTERIIQEELKSGEKGIRMTTWGFKFEQYLTSNTANSKPNTFVPVNENEKYYSVMTSDLDHHRMLFGTEMDALDPNHITRPGCRPAFYVELKTSKLLTEERQIQNFHRYKFLKWYLQSYFAGVPRLICGFRDDKGIVRMLRDYNVRDLPRMTKGLWSSTPCLTFLSEFLDYVKMRCTKDDPRIVYRFYWKPGSDVTCEILPPEFQILPDWYIESVENL